MPSVKPSIARRLWVTGSGRQQQVAVFTLDPGVHGEGQVGMWRRNTKDVNRKRKARFAASDYKVALADQMAFLFWQVGMPDFQPARPR